MDCWFDLLPANIREAATGHSWTACSTRSAALATLTWRWIEFKRVGLPVIYIDARLAKAVLKMQINKSRLGGSKGCTSRISTATRSGRYWQPGAAGQDQARSLEPCLRPSQESRSRHWPRQVQCLCRANRGVIAGRPELVGAIRPLLKARDAVGHQVSELYRKVVLARHDAFMTVLGVGPIGREA